ncbi:MAG: hypothetical protein JO235_02875 [Chroococcidiopsidaceae cyanobacterium CP_BM_RX_35]|nr:hypothetical protein [Chroococcidiopsidaceae cyanobacterium CP_BM_RX_35]
MAKLTNETFNISFNLLRQFLKHIDSATAVEAAIFEQFGETEETIYELEQLQNIRERATSSYTRLHVLLLRIAEAQPVAAPATIDLLTRSIEQAQATNAAADASLHEIKQNRELL